MYYTSTTYNDNIPNVGFLSNGGAGMTAREEMEGLLSILTPEELSTALRLFQEYSLKKQAVQQFPYPKDLPEEQIVPA